MLDITSLTELTKKAYKKLKASVYFDKSLLPLRDNIVAYEDKNIDRKLCHIGELLEGSVDDWHRYVESIIGNIDVLLT